MSKNFHNVEGHAGLSKNSVTGTVLNMNTNEIQGARSRKKNRVIEQEENQKMKDDIKDLKSEMSEIKSLLKQIAEK